MIQNNIEGIIVENEIENTQTLQLLIISYIKIFN